MRSGTTCCSTTAAEADLHLVRAVHERDDQRGPVRSRSSISANATAASTCCSSTTSSSSPARKRRRTSSSTRSTRSTTRRSRSCISSDCPPHEIPRARGTPAIALRMGTDRGHPAAGSRDENRDSEEESGRRSGAAARRRRDIHRGQDQVEHPRARGIADSPDRVRVAHWSSLAGACAASAAGHHRHDEKAVTIELIQKFFKRPYTWA